MNAELSKGEKYLNISVVINLYRPYVNKNTSSTTINQGEARRLYLQVLHCNREVGGGSSTVMLFMFYSRC